MMGKFTVALMVVGLAAQVYACTSDSTSSAPAGPDASAPDASTSNEVDGSPGDANNTKTDAAADASDAAEDSAAPKLTTDGVVCTIDGTQMMLSAIGTCSPTGVAAYDTPSGQQLTVGFGKMGIQTCATGDTGGLVYARKNDAGANETFIAGNGYASCTVDATSIAGGAGQVNEGTFSGMLKKVSGGSVTVTKCAYRCTM